MSYLFPAAFMANTFAMTALLIMLGLAGDTSLAADVGIVQGATLALFYAFSGNARNLILNQSSPVSAQSVMTARLFLMLPLAGAAYWLSVGLAGVEPILATILILRRCVEWLDEVFLSEMERLNSRKIPLNYIVFQSIFLLFAIGWTLGKMPFPLIGIFLWALLPLLLNARFYWRTIHNLSKTSLEISEMLPHLGSTVIIGVTVYIFRLLIILMTGKNIAGDLFTAFAIGGVLGSIFANAIGPSLALHQKRSLNYRMPTIIKFLLILFSGIGLSLVVMSLLNINIFSFTGKTMLFWQATGLSMIAGTVMVFAQMIRHRLLQHHQEQDLFGPDVMMNILIIAAIPFVHNLFGLQMMSALYLLSAIFAYLFYASYEFGEGFKSGTSTNGMRKLKIALVAMLLVPIFFQLHGGVFNEKVMVFHSNGVLSLLPIPLSVLGCFLGVLLLGNYQQAKLSFAFIFTTFISMTFATVISSGQHAGIEGAKFILLIQFILPMFGLVFGQMYSNEKNNNDFSFEIMVLYVLLLILPTQLILSWSHNSLVLKPSLGFFSIYQHLQYVPTVIVCAFLVALYSLWQQSKYRYLLLILLPITAIYVSASMSMLAIGMFLIGLLLLVTQQRIYKTSKMVLIFLCMAGLSFGYLQFSMAHSDAVAEKFDLTTQLEEKYQNRKEKEEEQIKRDMLNMDLNSKGGQEYIGKLEQYNKELQQQAALFTELKKITKIPLPLNILERIYYWQHYYFTVVNEPKILLIGNDAVLDRSKYPSAHNYYLDFIFNFGLLAFLPLLALFMYTFIKIFRARAKVYISLSLVGLCIAVFFLLVFDNSLKVSLRQPYSGIFTFFLWGLLINKLSYISKRNINVTKV